MAKEKLAAVEDSVAQKNVTYVEFKRENGVRVVIPNGKYLRYVKKNPNPGMGNGSANDSDFHIVGIKNVLVSSVGLVFLFDNGIERHFPYSEISNFTIE